MMSPTWYDLLDVDPSASTDEIRAAWKAAIADLDPTDRRFRTLNEAATVLLDDGKRSAYDAEVAAREAEAVEAEPADPTDPTTGADPEAIVEESADAADESADAAEEEPAEEEGEQRARQRRRRLPAIPTWVLAALAVLTAAAVVAVVVTLVRGGGHDVVTAANDNDTTSTLDTNYGAKISHDHTTQIEEHAEGVLAAAKAAAVPILSYDYRHMDAAQQQAHAHMTTNYRKQYDKLFAVLRQNAPQTKVVVKALAPLDAGIVRVSDDRVQVLLFVDMPTTNAKSSKPIPYQNYATFTMARQDGKWLVDAITTKPAE